MPFARALFAARLTRLVVMWLMAAVLPLQATAVGVFNAIGPAHVHQRAEAPLVLEDFRRWKPAAVAAAPAFTTAFKPVLDLLGHSHAALAPQRHHHAADDGSVLLTGGESALDSAQPDEALGASGLSVLALIPAVPGWAPATQPGAAATRAPWALRTGFVTRLDRPPRRG